MRYFFLSLLLCNLWFAAWQLWVAPPRVAPAEPLVAGPESRLAVVATNKAAASRGNESAGTCLRLGPIAEAAVAEQLKGRLLAEGLTDISVVTEEKPVWKGHWVQAGEFAVREEALQAVTQLVAGGLADAHVPAGGPPFRVSLGVYLDRGQADAVAASASKLGIAVRITDRFGPGRRFWLQGVALQGQQLTLERVGRESGQILRSETISCQTRTPSDWRKEPDSIEFVEEERVRRPPE